MTRIVIDASVMGPLIFEDEEHHAIASLPASLTNGDCLVPAHWRFEVANLIRYGATRGRVTPAEVEIIITALKALPVEVDLPSIDQAWVTTLRLAAKHKLTIHDAAYLELALRLGVALASFDKALIFAANESGITVISA